MKINKISRSFHPGFSENFSEFQAIFKQHSGRDFALAVKSVKSKKRKTDPVPLPKTNVP